MPLSKAVIWILLVTLCITGSALMGWLYYLHMRDLRLKDDQYRIVAIVQNAPRMDALKTVYLAELLNLSFDSPSNLYQFNVKEARETLLKHSLIKEAAVKKILPGTLYIDYAMRVPVALVGDFSNTAVDRDGYLFPFRPFFTPKHLPTLYLGLNGEECQWGSCIGTHSPFRTAIDIIRRFQCLDGNEFEVKQVDVAQIFSDSYGRRQIVLVLEKRTDIAEGVSTGPRKVTLRLNAHQDPQDFINFHTLNTYLSEKGGDQDSIIIDLRMPHLAFIRAER